MVENLTLNPETTALLVVDVQNDFAHSKGYLGRILGSRIHEIRKIIPPLRALIQTAKTNNLCVVWVQSIRTKNNCETKNHKILPWQAFNNWLGGPTKGTWGAKIVDEIRPSDKETVIQKSRNSAFFKTRLERFLRDRGIKTLLMTGLTSSVCVESTLRDAFFRDFDVILVEDCCADSERRDHLTTVRIVKRFYGISLSSSSIIKALSAKSK